MSVTGPGGSARIAACTCASMRLTVSVEKSGRLKSGVWTSTPCAASFGAEERRLRRLRGRGEAVQVEDVHQSVTLQPGRQRHGIEAAPSV